MPKLDITKEHVENFFRELRELEKRYGLEIGGCGCCGSPFLSYKNYVVADCIDQEDPYFCEDLFED